MNTCFTGRTFVFIVVLALAPIGCAQLDGAGKKGRSDHAAELHAAWQDTVQPILNSQESGRVYKCTTCHSQYTEQDYVMTEAGLSEIIRSVSGGKMPLGGTPMAAADVEALNQVLRKVSGD